MFLLNVVFLINKLINVIVFVFNNVILIFQFILNNYHEFKIIYSVNSHFQ
jgi:hypothetical protein